MFGNGKRNGNGVAVAAITTLIAEGTVIRGDVEFTGGLHLDGRIEGNVYYKVLEMAAGAQINGKMVYQAEEPRQLPRPEIAVAEA